MGTHEKTTAADEQIAGADGAPSDSPSIEPMILSIG